MIVLIDLIIENGNNCAATLGVLIALVAVAAVCVSIGWICLVTKSWWLNLSPLGVREVLAMRVGGVVGVVGVPGGPSAVMDLR